MNRKMTKKIILVFTYLLAMGTLAFADSISLEQARTLALANSRSLAQYNLSIQSSILNERSQLYSMLPTVSADYSASMSYLNNKWKFENPVDTFGAQANFSVTQKIFEGGKSFIQKALSSIATESVRLDALAEFFNVLDSLDNAYYAALEAAANLESAEVSLQTAVLSLSMAEIRQSSGMINQGDYLKALSDKESRENSRNQARRAVSLATARLRSLTGLSELPALEPIDFTSYENALARLAEISDDETSALYETFFGILAQSNPSLAKAVLNNERAEKNLSLAKRAYSPSLSATLFSTGVSYSGAGGFGNTAGGGVSLTGRIPLDFWVMNNSIEQSKIAQKQTQLSYIDTEESLETELQTALLDVFAQAGSVLSSRRAYDYSEKHLEFIMERYRLSQGSVSELSDASALASGSRVQLIGAEYGFLRSLSKLRSLGAIDDEQRLMNIIEGNAP